MWTNKRHGGILIFMQGIEFEDDNNYTLNQTAGAGEGAEHKASPLLRMVFKLGVTDIAIANYILIGVAVIIFGITIFIYADILSGVKYDPTLDSKAISEMIKNSP